MGVFSLFSSSSRSRKISSIDIIQNATPNLPNPNPANYKILRSEQIDNYLVVEIQYLDCINYEGKKILVYRDCTLDKLKKQKLIDPHFCENKNFLSPIVRFEPTDDGWENALKFINALLV